MRHWRRSAALESVSDDVRVRLNSGNRWVVVEEGAGGGGSGIFAGVYVVGLRRGEERGGKRRRMRSQRSEMLDRREKKKGEETRDAVLEQDARMHVTERKTLCKSVERRHKDAHRDQKNKNTIPQEAYVAKKEEAQSSNPRTTLSSRKPRANFLTK